MRFAVAVALHRPYWAPQDPLYLPVQVGAALNPPLGMQRDDEGDHISLRNPTFNELTAHYWLWKNSSAQVKGLCHYRRYFSVRHLGRKQDRVLTLPQAENLLKDADVIVPTPRVYLIETNYTQYIHAHHRADLELTRQIITERCPDCLACYDRVMKRRWGRRFNMCIMRSEMFDAYSGWLFGILFELEKRLDISYYNEKDRRVFGYVAERLMDVWLEKEHPRMKQVRVVNLESQHWPRKIATFLRRRFLPDEKRKHVNG